MEARVKGSGRAWRLRSKCAIQARPREFAGQRKKVLPDTSTRTPRAWEETRHGDPGKAPYMGAVRSTSSPQSSRPKAKFGRRPFLDRFEEREVGERGGTGVKGGGIAFGALALKN